MEAAITSTNYPRPKKAGSNSDFGEVATAFSIGHGFNSTKI
jgi:hypothetical protein